MRSSSLYRARLVTQSCLTLSDPMDSRPTRLPCPWGFSRPEYWSGDTPLQGTSPTQGSNPGLPHCRQILYHLSHQQNPLAPWPGIKSRPLALSVQNLSHWTREVLGTEASLKGVILPSTPSNLLSSSGKQLNGEVVCRDQHPPPPPHTHRGER